MNAIDTDADLAPGSPEHAALLERLVAMTRDLALIPSTDRRPRERRRCFEFCRNHLEALPGVEIREYEKNGYTSLVALPAGHAVPEVLLCGHLDVIEHPSRSPYATCLENGRILGPGVGDMKGALAIGLELARHWYHHRPGVSLGLAITSDEERGGESGMRYLLEEIGLRCGVAMVPDGGSLNEIIIEEKGILHLRMRAGGTSCHAARPWLGSNAVELLADALGRLRSRFAKFRVDGETAPSHWYPTCSVTAINTPNPAINSVPSEATAMVDVRFVPPWTRGTMLELVKAVVGPGVAVNPIISAEPTHLAPDPIYVQATERITGKRAHLVRSSGGSDARFFCAYGIPVLLTRPLVGELHSENEWIDIESMGTFFRIGNDYLHRKFSV